MEIGRQILQTRDFFISFVPELPVAQSHSGARAERQESNWKGRRQARTHVGKLDNGRHSRKPQREQNIHKWPAIKLFMAACLRQDSQFGGSGRPAECPGGGGKLTSPTRGRRRELRGTVWAAIVIDERAITIDFLPSSPFRVSLGAANSGGRPTGRPAGQPADVKPATDKLLEAAGWTHTKIQLHLLTFFARLSLSPNLSPDGPKVLSSQQADRLSNLRPSRLPSRLATQRLQSCIAIRKLI